MPSPSRVVVVDFGGQYSHLIARRCRELGVYSEIVPYDVDIAGLLGGAPAPTALILSGGPKSVYDDAAPHLDPSLLELGIPVLGICYGHQLMAHALGGRVERARRAEYGRTEISVLGESELLEGVPSRFSAWMSHGDAVMGVPPGFRETAVSEAGLVAGMEDPRRRLYGVQFHPEVKHTEYGMRILENFLRRISGADATWNPADRVGEIVDGIRREVGEGGDVLCAVSGGVDSMTTAALVHRAVGDRLHVVFVDHGLLRKGEVEEVLSALGSLGIGNVHFVDASDRFLEALRGVEDPEEKRRVIGELFARVFEEVAADVGGVRYLAQGTIYPDRVESGAAGRASDRIKSHHNVAGLPERFGLKLVEPLRDLYKDEVRQVARAVGLSSEILDRHPFPGPGLAVRVEGEVTEEKLRIARDANAIVEEEFRRSGAYGSVWQAFAVVLESRWVGVMGDRRRMGYVVVVRAVTSDDGMTADWYPAPSELLGRISKRITEEVDGVSMVAYAVTSKPPSTIEAC